MLKIRVLPILWLQHAIGEIQFYQEGGRACLIYTAGSVKLPRAPAPPVPAWHGLVASDFNTKHSFYYDVDDEHFTQFEKSSPDPFNHLIGRAWENA